MQSPDLRRCRTEPPDRRGRSSARQNIPRERENPGLRPTALRPAVAGGCRRRPGPPPCGGGPDVRKPLFFGGPNKGLPRKGADFRERASACQSAGPTLGSVPRGCPGRKPRGGRTPDPHRRVPAGPSKPQKSVPLWLRGDPAAQIHPTPATPRRPDLRHRTCLAGLRGRPGTGAAAASATAASDVGVNQARHGRRRPGYRDPRGSTRGRC